MYTSLIGTHEQPAIASFATELIDEILRLLVADPDHLTKEERVWLKGASTIARNFRGPAQRLLMRHFVFQEGRHAGSVISELASSGFRPNVKHLEYTLKESDRTLWGLRQFHRTFASPKSPPPEDNATYRDHFLAVLLLFPHILSLRMNFPLFNSLEGLHINRIKSSGPVLTRLSSLTIETRPGEHDVELVHDLLRLAPEITTLRLVTDGSSELIEGVHRFKPVELPRLRHFQTDGRGSGLLGLAVLSKATLARIEDLNWGNSFEYSPSVQAILRIAGPSLRTLAYSPRHGETAADLQLCPVLEHLVLPTLPYWAILILIQSLPSTVHTVTVLSLEAAHYLLVNLKSHPGGALKTIRVRQSTAKPEYLHTHYLEGVTRVCKSTQLELVEPYIVA